MLTRRLNLADAAAVQVVYDSQPRVMLREKEPSEVAYEGVFRNHLLSGCISYGAFLGAELLAFCTVWPWPGLPIGTLVLFVNKPNGAVFNPEKTGLAAAVDAALDHLAADGVPTVYFVRAQSKKWKNSRVTRNFGTFGESFSRDVEYINAGSLSKNAGINAYVLGNSPPKADAVLVCVMRKPLGDF